MTANVGHLPYGEYNEVNRDMVLKMIAGNIIDRTCEQGNV